MGLHILRQPDETSARSLVAHNLARLLFFRVSLHKRRCRPPWGGKLAWIDALLEAWGLWSLRGSNRLRYPTENLVHYE
jgi:hypothetical protein